jgi:flagellar hook protein FlgE
MSLYGLMRTGVSGMSAQSSKLSMVADNVANADSTGYKRASAEFSALVLNSTYGQYQSGGVLVHGRQHVGEQGTLRYSSSGTDLAISGNGFFIVQDPNGQVFLTRAGSFIPNADGELVNAAGFKLLGQPAGGQGQTLVANGFDGLQVVNINNKVLQAKGSEQAKLNVNLSAGQPAIAAAQLPSANAANAAFNAKTSLIAYDSLGGEVTLDIYFAKTAANTWEAAIYDRSTAASGGGFPHSSGPMAVTPLAFDPATGKLTAPAGATVAVPGGETVALDLSDITQLATAFTVVEARVDGNPPGVVSDVEITQDGAVTGIMRNGVRLPLGQIALADVPSPDRLTRESGNVFAVSEDSGDVRVGFGQSGGFGAVMSGALEESTVDIASELTDMIQSQRTYTANSKVFMTGAELMDVLVNLKR